MTRIAVVTGGNQGLGLALVRGLSKRLGPEATVYLTARNRERGEAAVKALEAEGLPPRFEQLDVTDDASVTALAATLRQRHGGIDIVLSNAAARISPELSNDEQVRGFFDTNNVGTHRVMRAFGPLLRDGGRFIVVASFFGALRHLPPALRPQFEHRTLDQLEDVFDSYVELVETGRAEAAGWPAWINVPSKAGQVASMRAFVDELGDEAAKRDIVVTAACPGLVDTEASRPWFDDMSSAKTADEAAVDVLWLATLPAGSRAQHGKLVQYRQIIG